MPIPSGYTSGQVVQAVPSLSAYAVTSSTRPASPFDGQIISETDTDSLQIYKGSAWGGVGGLQYITGASFTAVTSVSLPNDTFTATYTNYLILFYCNGVGLGSDITARFRAAGSDNTTSNYAYAANALYSNGNDAQINGNGVSSFGMRESQINFPYSATLTIYEPQTANKANVSGMIVGNGNTTTAHATNIPFSGIFNDTTSFDSFSFLSAATITGKYKVYGYSNS
jgi:hypothetical protein